MTTKYIPQAKWKSKHTENLQLSVRKGVKENLKAIAANSGKNLTEYILEAIKEKALREDIMTEEQAETFAQEDTEGIWRQKYTEWACGPRGILVTDDE